MEFGPWPGSGANGAPFPSGSKFWSERFFARDMAQPTAAHPVVVGAAIAADGLYPDITIGSFLAIGNKGLTFRSRVPSVASHGTNAGTMVASLAMKAGGVPVAPNLNVQFRLYTRRILSGAPLAAWDLAGFTCNVPLNNGAEDFVYRDWLAPFVIGADINLAAGEYFEAEIVRNVGGVDDSPLAANLYAVNLAWLAA